MTTKRFDVTAIIYDKKGNILSIGNNSYVKTHPMQARLAEKVGEPHKIFLHAEIHAITRCAEITRAHTMRIFRYTKDGQPATARPCKICAEAISKTSIKVVEHT